MMAYLFIQFVAATRKKRKHAHTRGRVCVGVGVSVRMGSCVEDRDGKVDASEEAIECIGRPPTLRDRKEERGVGYR